jgi:excisionase family DNA binding protein
MSKRLESGDLATRLAFGRAEVATLLGVSYRHVLNEIQRGRLREITSGRRKLVSRAELDRYLATQEQNGQTHDASNAVK